MVLYRRVGAEELRLIEGSGFTAFPPRLPRQPIFYPVLNRQYAAEIAERWNTMDKNSGYQGFITRFEVDDGFLARYQIQTVGRSYHQESWIPAEDLAEFVRHIVGKIEVIRTIGAPL